MSVWFRSPSLTTDLISLRAWSNLLKLQNFQVAILPDFGLIAIQVKFLSIQECWFKNLWTWVFVCAVRSAKFIPRKQWVVAGADDMHIRVYNYNTMDKIKTFEAHTDYIRCVAVHPTLPYVLSSSDDMLIKIWDWDKGWICTQIFEGHSHYVMQVTFNPKDTNTFASASLDRTIKVPI
jgi:WD40 repeat protein